MNLWELNRNLVFPPHAVLAYVKNILHESDSVVVATQHVAAMAGYHWLKGVGSDGAVVDLFAPYVVSDLVVMYVPFILQGVLSGGELHWGRDGRSTRGCFRIARQVEETEFRMIANRAAFIQYARSGRPPEDQRGLIEYGLRRDEFIEANVRRGIMREIFQFVGNDGRGKVVPFIPSVFNPDSNMEIPNAATRSVGTAQRP